jgi:hypothetical protein
MTEERLREEVKHLRWLHEHNFVKAGLANELVEDEAQVVESSPWRQN